MDELQTLLDPSKRSLYDLGDDGPANTGVPPHLAYPDWNEESTTTVTGPVGASPAKGKRFPDTDSACAYWAGVHGSDPIERHYWPMAVTAENPDAEGGKYGFRFRKKKKVA